MSGAVSLRLFRSLLALMLCAIGTVMAGCAVNAPPPPHTAAPPQATAEPSLVDVPIHVSLSGALAQLEQQVPTQFNSDGYPDFPDDYRWHVQRDPFRFALGGPNVTVSDQLGYSAGYQKCAWFICAELASCGENEPLRRIDIGYRTAITFNTDYTIGSSTAVDHVTPIDRCDVTIFNIDITGRVAGAVGGVMDRTRVPSTTAYEMRRGRCLRGSRHFGAGWKRRSRLGPGFGSAWCRNRYVHLR